MKLIILLSTYNAQLYLREQLDSLLAQTSEDFYLVVRDDGSKDDTLSILEEYAGRYPFISYYTGENLGVRDSFFDLMKKIQKEAFDFVAFCDQDDFWLPEKLERATNILSLFCRQDTIKKVGQEAVDEVPLLYCGKPQLVDKELHPMEQNIKRTIRPGFANALVENIVTGCTMVLNRSMYDIVMQQLPNYCIMHDWWMYLVASCFGQVIYDEIPMIYYRQHDNNVMGIDGSRTTELKHRAKKFKSRKSNISMQAKELLLVFGKLEPKAMQMEKKWAARGTSIAEANHVKVSHKEPIAVNRQRAYLLAEYKKGRNRLRLCFGKVMYRQRKMDDFIFRILFLFGLR